MKYNKILGGVYMKISKIVGVQTRNRIAALALGTGMLLSAAKVQAGVNGVNGVSKDAFTPVATQKSDKDSLVGGFLFGGTILAWMGAVALGNKLHDKQQ